MAATYLMFGEPNIITIGEFLDKYLFWAKENIRSNNSGRENPDITKIKRACHFLTPYHSWPVGDFGQDELKAVQKALVNHEYMSGKTKKRYIYLLEEVQEAMKVAKLLATKM